MAEGVPAILTQDEGLNVSTTKPQHNNSNNKKTRNNNNNHSRKNSQKGGEDYEDFSKIVVDPVDPCDHPDFQAFNAEQTALKRQMVDSKKRIQDIDKELQELQVRKNNALEALKPSSDLLRQIKSQKKELFNQIEDNKKLQEKANSDFNAERDALRQLKKNLPYQSEEEILAVVEDLERLASASGNSLREEKAIIGKIRSVKAKKADLKVFQEKELAFKNRPDALTPLKEARSKISQQLTDVKSQEKSLQSQVDTLREELNKISEAIQALKNEKNALFSQRKITQGEIESQKAEFDASMQQFKQYQRYLKYKTYWDRKQEQEEREARRQQERAEREAYRQQKEAEREAELAKLDPYAEQKDILSSLSAYLKKFVVETAPIESTEEKEGETSRNEGQDDDDWSQFAKKAGKGKKQKTKKQKENSSFLVHTPDIYASFAKFGLKVPVTVQQVVPVLDEVEKLRTFYESAPHPSKLKEIHEGKKLLQDEIQERRKRSNVTAPLFENERERVLLELKTEEEIEEQNVQAERVDAVKNAKSQAEEERLSRMSEITHSALQEALIRQFYQSRAVNLMEKEREARLAEWNLSFTLEELSRNARRKEVAKLRDNEVLRAQAEVEYAKSLEELSRKTRVSQAKSLRENELERLLTEEKVDQASKVSDAVLAAEKEQARRVSELLLNELLERRIRKAAIAKVAEAVEEERSRRIQSMKDDDAEILRAQQIAYAIHVAEEERERRLASPQTESALTQVFKSSPPVAHQ